MEQEAHRLAGPEAQNNDPGRPYSCLMGGCHGTPEGPGIPPRMLP